MEPVKVYTIPTCSDCNYAKRFFSEHNVPFIEYNCLENDIYAKEVKDLTGMQIVPTIVIDQKVLVGFAENLKEISTILNIK